jgi:xanthine dehydrogenase YagS FAD-binding subunit
LVGDLPSSGFGFVSAAAAWRIDGETIVEARLALGSVAAKPWRAHAAEALLAGAQANEANFRRAAEAALVDARPAGANGYKIELARRVVRRAFTLAHAGTPARIQALPASPFATGALRHV